MTDNQLQITIAEACGWTECLDGYWLHPTLTPKGSVSKHEIPNYLNAMRKAESYMPKNMTHTLTYLASPYSHPDPEVMEHRWEETMEAAAKLVSAGVFIFSPILHWHSVALRYDMPKDHVFWHDYNMFMLSQCASMIILTLDGWAASKGVQAEITHCNTHRIPYSTHSLESIRLLEPLKVLTTN